VCLFGACPSGWKDRIRTSEITSTAEILDVVSLI
jgi:hypothetical protein